MPAWIWEKQMEHFSPKYRVIAIDPRSQGESDKTPEGNYPDRRARDYKELVDHLKLSPVVLVGWSMGVPEIMAYVNPVRRQRLEIRRAGGRVHCSGRCHVEKFPGLSAPDGDGSQEVHRWFHSEHVQDASAGQLLPAPRGRFAETPTYTAAELLIVAHTDWTAALPKLAQTPVLFVVTSQVAKQLDVVRPAIPNVRAEVFEDSHHALFVDNAERFNAVLQKFLGGVPDK